MFSLSFTCRDSSMSTFSKTYKTFPSRECVTPLMKTFHLFPAVLVFTGNQNYTRLTGKLSWRLCSWAKGLHPTALFVFPTINSDNTGKASPPTQLLNKRLPFSGGLQLRFTDHAHRAGQYSSTQLNLNLILAAFNSQEAKK